MFRPVCVDIWIAGIAACLALLIAPSASAQYSMRSDQ